MFDLKKLFVKNKEEEIIKKLLKDKNQIKSIVEYIQSERDRVSQFKENELLKILGMLCIQEDDNQIKISTTTPLILPAKFGIESRQEKSGNFYFKIVYKKFEK